MHLTIETPRWAKPLLEPARYKCVYGGRGSGKSHFFAELLVEEHVANHNLKSVCIREVQKSIRLSVKSLIENKIQALGVGHLFDILDTEIRSRAGSGLITFQGMQNHTAESIKSLEGFDRAWVEEAQSISQTSLDLLRPTIRKEGSELWFSWNPRRETDAIDQFARAQEVPGMILVQANYSDNPWLPKTLKEEMEYDKRRDPDKYRHVWLGGYQSRSSALVFSNWRIEEFETPKDAHLRLGADWGFSVDPTVLVRCYIEGRKLYIDHEAYAVGVDIIDIPELFQQIPDSELWPISADSARPETISHLKKHGFPKIYPAKKGSGSLEEGVEWLKSFDIIVHPRCVHTIDELSCYQYKVDKDTDRVLPLLNDKKNHVIDALRYACESARRAKRTERPKAQPIPNMSRW